MALVVKTSDAFDMMGRHLDDSCKIFAPMREHRLVDGTLDESFDARTMDQPHRPGFEGRRENGILSKLVVAPPSAMCARLGAIDEEDPKLWSDLETIAGIFGQLAKSHLSGVPEDAHANNKSEALRLMGECARAVSKATRPQGAEAVPSQAWEAFEQACAHVEPLLRGDPSSRLAALCALRGYAEALAPEGAGALLAGARVEFSALAEAKKRLIESKPLPKDKPPIAGLPRLVPRASERREQEIAPYKLIQNGSFSSSLAAVFGSLDAVVSAAPAFAGKLGPEHMVHRHILMTPEGEVRGVDNIGKWIDAVRAIGEALRLAGESKPGNKSTKTLSI